MTKARIGTWLGVAALIVVGLSIWRDVMRSGDASTADTAGESASAQPLGAKVDLGTGAFPSDSGATWDGRSVGSGGGAMFAALKEAGRTDKHLFALFVRRGATGADEMRDVFANAQRSLGERALFRVADVGDRGEKAFIRKYSIERAPLPMTLVFAPNGAIVKAFPGKVVGEADLEKAFASPTYARVMRALQDRKLVLLCAQGRNTRHNAESLQAARAAATGKKSGGFISVIQAAPEDAANADVFRPLGVDAGLEEATVFILVPPSTLAGKVAGAASPEVIWATIAKGVAGCGPEGCGPEGCGP